MRRTLAFITTAFILFSCGTGLKVRKKNVVPLDATFTATICNVPHLVKGRHYGTQTALNLFEFGKVDADTVHIRFDDQGRLLLSFKETYGNRTETFEGKFNRKKGYYEIFLRNIRKEVPPYFPVIYGYRDIDRFRIGLTTDNELVIDNKWARDGNIFLLAGGGSGRYQCFYKIRTLK